MKINPVPALSLDELATETIRLGRELHELAHEIYVGGNVRDFGFAARAMGRLAERQPFDSRDTASLEALRSIIDTDLSREVVRTERRFVETRYDNDGQHGEIREIPVYSARGETLLRLQEMLTSFLAARDAVLDRIAADRALMQLLRA